MATNEITLTIKADDDASAVLDKLKKKIKGLGDEGQDAADKLGKGKGGGGGGKAGLGGSLAGFAVAAGPYAAAAAVITGAIVKIGKALVGAAAEVETLRSQLKTVEGTSENADKRLGELVQTSKEIIGLDLNNLIAFNTQLKTTGLNSKEVDTVVGSTTKALAQMGFGTEKVKQVLGQLGQAFASNKLASEDLKTVFREMPAFSQAVSATFGENVKSLDQFQAAAKAAGLDAREALLTVLDELNETAKGASLDTFSAQTELLSENFQQFKANIGGTFLQSLTGVMKVLNDMFSVFEEGNTTLKDAWDAFTTIVNAVTPLGLLFNIVKTQVKVFTEALPDTTGWLDTLGNAFNKVKDLVWPVIQAISNFKNIIEPLLQLALESWLHIVTSALGLLWKAATPIVEVFGNILSWAGKLASQFLEALPNAINQFKVTILGALLEIGNKIINIPVIGKLISDDALFNLENAHLDAIEFAEAQKQNAVDVADTQAAEAQRAKEAQEAIWKDFRDRETTARIAYLDALKTLETNDFDGRRNAVNIYYDAVDARIRNSGLTATEVDDAIKASAEKRKTELGNIATAETGKRVEELDAQLEALKNTNDALAADESTTRQEMIDAATAYYDLNVTRLQDQVTLGKATDADLIAAKGDYDAAIRKINDDFDKAEDTRRANAIKAEEQRLSDTRAAFLSHFDVQADAAQRHLDNITEDANASLENRLTANDDYYIALRNKRLANEEDATKHAGIIEDTEKERLDNQTKLQTGYWDALIQKQHTANQVMDGDADASLAKREAGVSRLHLLKAEKIKAEIKDDDVRRDKLELNQREMNTEIERMRQADANAKKATAAATLQETLDGIDKEIEAQQLAMEVMATNENTSAEEREAAVNRLYDLRAERLHAAGGDAEVLKNNLILLEAEREAAVTAIWDAETEYHRQKQLQKVADAEQALADILADENSTAEDINAAAQRVYDEKKVYIDEYVKDEEDAADQLEAIQTDLDNARTSSIKRFWKEHGKLVQMGLDLVAEAAMTEINLLKTVRDAERSIQHDRAKARIDFQSQWDAIVSGYDKQIDLARKAAQPHIEAAIARGDKEEANRLQAELDRLIGMTDTGQIIKDEEGNLQGLVKERSDALQEITDTLNTSEQDFFEEIRNIQNEAKKERTKAWWDIGGQAVGGLLGIGASVLSGGAIDMTQAAKFGTDLGGFVGKEIGDVQASGIQDDFLRQELGIYQTQQTRAAQNAAKGIYSGSELPDVLKGTDFDPAVIEQRRLDAEENIQKRLKELLDDRIDDVEWARDQAKRKFDRWRKDETKTLADLTTAYDIYYEEQKTLAHLQITDTEDRNRELRRLWWQRVDTLEGVKNAINSRQEPETQTGEPTERRTSASRRTTAGVSTGTADTSEGGETSEDAGDAGSEKGQRAAEAAARAAKAERIDDLRWEVKNAKYILDEKKKDETATLAELQNLYYTYFNFRKDLALEQARDEEDRNRVEITFARQHTTELAAIDKHYYDTQERLRRAAAAEAARIEKENQATQNAARRAEIDNLKWQIENTAYLFAKQRNDENASLQDVQGSLQSLYDFKKQLAALETEDAVTRQRRLIRLERQRVDTLESINAKFAKREADRQQALADEQERINKETEDAEKEAAQTAADAAARQRALNIANLKWNIEQATYALGQLKTSETAALAELQGQHRALWDFKKQLAALETDDAIERQRALIRLERQRTASLEQIESDYYATLASLDERRKKQQETLVKDAADETRDDLRWKVETAKYYLDRMIANEEATLEELQGQHELLYHFKMALAKNNAGDEEDIQREIIRVTRDAETSKERLIEGFNRRKEAREKEAQRETEKTNETTVTTTQAQNETLAETTRDTTTNITKTAEQSTESIAETATSAVDAQTRATQTMIDSLNRNAQKTESSMKGVASTLADIGKTLKAQTEGMQQALNDIADETVDAIYTMLDSLQTASGERVTTETDADDTIASHRETTMGDMQTGVTNVYTTLNTAATGWREHFETELQNINTAATTQLPTLQGHFDNLYTHIKGKHDDFWGYFVNSFGTAVLLVETALDAMSEDFDDFYTARDTAMDTWLGDYFESLGIQVLLTQTATDAMETEYTALYDALRSQATAYADFQRDLLADIGTQIDAIRDGIQNEERRVNALRNDATPRRNRRTGSTGNQARELFHFAETDAIAAAGGAVTASIVKRQNAQDFTDFFSQGFLNQLRQSGAPAPGSGDTDVIMMQPVVVNAQFDDGTVKKLAEVTVELKRDGRLL